MLTWSWTIHELVYQQCQSLYLLPTLYWLAATWPADSKVEKVIIVRGAAAARYPSLHSLLDLYNFPQKYLDSTPSLLIFKLPASEKPTLCMPGYHDNGNRRGRLGSWSPAWSSWFIGLYHSSHFPMELLWGAWGFAEDGGLCSGLYQSQEHREVRVLTEKNSLPIIVLLLPTASSATTISTRRTALVAIRRRNM